MIQKLFIIHFQLAQVHTKVQTSFTQYLLDLSQGFLTEIAEFHQVFLLIGHQLAKAVDLGCFQTVEGADGKIEIFQRGLQDLTQLQRLLIYQVFLLLFFIIESDVLVSDDHQMLDQDAAGLLNGLLGMDSTVGRHLHDQLFEVGALFNAGILDGILHEIGRASCRERV